ncbi:MAG: TRAP transporter small permease [Alphaproteobacteria bacterium]|nr:TRAP transporter small permease [Alphaproteobacteria bacterium]
MLTRLCVIAGGCLLVALVAGEVVFRYAVQQSLIFSDELARYSFIWVTFLGASLALRRGQHIGLELGYHERWALLRAAVHLSVAIFLVIFLWTSAKLVPAMWAQRSPLLDISMGWVFLALPVGAALMLLQLLARIAGLGPDRDDH